MTLKNCAAYCALALLFMALPACKTVQPKPGQNDMRIWIAPAYRTNTNVDQLGHLYVNVNEERRATAPAPSPSRTFKR